MAFRDTQPIDVLTHRFPELHADTVRCFLEGDVGQGRIRRRPFPVPDARANQTTSPARLFAISPPSHCAQPTLSVTTRVWPHGFTFHEVREPGAN